MYSFGMGIRFPDSPLKKLQDSARLMSRCSLTTIFFIPKESDTRSRVVFLRFCGFYANTSIRLEYDQPSEIALEQSYRMLVLRLEVCW